MGQGGERVPGRAHWIFLFALFLCALSAAPVLAESEPSPEPSAPVASPSPEELSVALKEAEQEAEAEERAHEEELASSEAQQERDSSRDEFADLSGSDAQDLLLATFSEQLKELDADPARILSDLDIQEVLGSHAVQVENDEGENEVVESSIPVESQLPGEEREPVDLSLENAEGGFVPENALAETHLPSTLGGQIEIGTQLTVDGLPGDPETPATKFESTDLFFAGSDVATDTIVAPISHGVEVFEQLRSPESPEEFGFGLSLPSGGSLRLDERGGAEAVDSSGEPIGLIPAPYAVDAQGTDVPVSLEVDGHSILLRIPHRSQDVAYPILLDPILEDGQGWYMGWNPGSLTQWSWNEAAGAGYQGKKSCFLSTDCWGSGLYTRSQGNNYYYYPGSWGQFSYVPPNTTSYVRQAGFWPINGDVHNCPNAHPHGYVGMWNNYVGYGPGGGSLGLYAPVSVATAGYDTGEVGTNGTRMVNVGVKVAENGISLACGHEFFVGGTTLWLDDPEPPTLASVSGLPGNQWITDTTPVNITVKATDPGLGVRLIKIGSENGLIPIPVDCSGVKTSPCPAERTHQFKLNGLAFDQGEKEAKITAEDPVGNIWHVSSPYIFTTKVDRTPPEVALSGQLAKATAEEVAFGEKEKPQENGKDELSLPVYNLSIAAKDGSKASPGAKRSGVKNVEVKLDGVSQPVPWVPLPSCPETSCEMKATFPLKLVGLSAGTHKLEVFATDFVNKTLERDIEFEYIPATGMKDDYVMHHFPLPDGKGNEAEEEEPDRPELAVNVMNGNLVYREKDVDVPGYATDLEVERFYNSQLPNSANTEWGDGWTLAQTPELEPEAGATPKEAQLMDTSGALEDEVQLPTEAGKTSFDPSLQATVTKEAGGGYELADDSGETDTAIVFDSSGRTDELRTEGYAKVDFDYEAGKLDEIAIKDPGSASDLSEAEEEAFEYVPPAPTYKSAFGALGSGDGQLKAPGDIALAANGDLFVVDKGNNRIERFNQEGKYLSKFGTAGSGNGQFKRPCSIAIDASGSIYVADTENNRIQKFTEAGAFVKAIGIAGTGNGQFAEPEGIAIDAKGNVLVADTYNQRIQKFNSALEFITKFGSSGTGNGQFNRVNSIDVGPEGTIWAADWGLSRITKFTASGVYALKFGSEGTGSGQFKSPDAIEVDSRGNVFVGDEGNNRVQQFNQAGKYLAQFGSKGSGAGQFSFTWPMGIAVDNKGGLWVADVANNRIQKWGIPNYRPSWYGAFGTVGSGDGQMKAPADSAIAPNGDVFVLDKGNARVLRFNREGKYLSKFGTGGTANGQLKAPTSIAIDGSGNLWVTDAGNYRIQEFTEGGAFVRAIGSQGTGNAQFSIAEGIATDLKGNIYVADTYNRRIQVFDEEGKYLFKFGSAGSGLGQFTEANAVDIGRHGNIYVADWGASKIQVFNEKGEPAMQFGSTGAGDGQFNHADAVEADDKGNVWVGDQSNGRIELFNEAGEYLTQFGSQGSGEGQFSFTYPMGVTADPSGGLWITDVSNNRIQKWQIPNTDPPKPPEENDPAVDVGLSSGLVSSVEGDEAGTNTYAHTGDLLTANKGPDGETKYEYDSEGRLKKVTLPNGTYGSITYNTTYGRVSKVTVYDATTKVTKSTTFTYSDDPRRTEVTPPSAPVITYDIGDDGSVLKWSNSKKAPEFRDLAGLLYFERETTTAISSGDKSLVIEAYSVEGIASIEVLTGDQVVVDEKTCAQDPEKMGVECQVVADEWVTNTANHGPGRLDIRAVITDREGGTESRHFWVNVPVPPPPPPIGAPKPPTFAQTLSFREEHGLDIDLDPIKDELEINDRVYSTLADWHAGDLVARASAERWGVPLHAPEVAELEYRLNYEAQNSKSIPAWAASHPSAGFAGYYVDERKGGLTYVGFTGGKSNSDVQIAALVQSGAVTAPERIRPFETLPSNSLATLETLEGTVLAIAGNAPSGAISNVGIDLKSNRVQVGANDLTQATNLLAGQLAGQPYTVSYQPAEQPSGVAGAASMQGRVHDYGSIKAGDLITSMSYEKDNIERRKKGEKLPNEGCTAGFGAWENGQQPNGNSVHRLFLLSVWHCFEPPEDIYRGNIETQALSHVGISKRSGAGYVDEFGTDATAIRVPEPYLASRQIYLDETRPPLDVRGVVQNPGPGVNVCHSGVTSDKVICGPILGPPRQINYEVPGGESLHWMVCYKALSLNGDSGGPVWVEGTHNAVGLLTYGWNFLKEEKGAGGVTWKILGGVTCLTPLLPLASKPDEAPGALNAPGMGELHIATRTP